MIYGLYLSAQGAAIQSLRQDVIANNLANASTNTFKRDMVRAQAHNPFDFKQSAASMFPAHGGLKNLPGGVTPLDVATDFSPATFTATKQPLDLALAERGFFQVTDGKQTWLTRNGQFTINEKQQLVTRDHGLKVLITTGTPFGGLDQSVPLEIMPDGTVMQAGDNFGKLAVVEPVAYPQLQKTGNNLYTTQGRVLPAKVVDVKSGYLEASGVKPMVEMVELIESERALESNVNMIKYQDDSLGKLLASLPPK